MSPNQPSSVASASAPSLYGVVAHFDSPGNLLDAAEHLRDAGFRKFDCHSPYPIHGMDEAMGEKRSRVSYVAAVGACVGGSSILMLIWWINVKAYPIIESGKPYFSYQAFFPVIFALCVLVAAFGALFGFMGLMGLKWNHPLFNSPSFGKFSDDGFIVSVEASDPQFDVVKTVALLKSLGATEVLTVEGEC